MNGIWTCKACAERAGVEWDLRATMSSAGGLCVAGQHRVKEPIRHLDETMSAFAPSTEALEANTPATEQGDLFA